MIIEKKSKKILYQGAKFTVEYAIQNNGSYEAEEFIDSLSIPDRTKIIRIITRIIISSGIPIPNI